MLIRYFYTNKDCNINKETFQERTNL